MMTTVRSGVALAMMASACSGPADGNGRAGLAASLEPRTFVSESVEGWTLVSGTEVRISFVAGELRASAGCNSISGPYSLEGDRLSLPGYGVTGMGCDPARHAQDERLRELLSAKPVLELSEPRLTMTSASSKLVLLDREVAHPDRPLVGTLWKGDATIDGGSVSGGFGMAFSIEFGADGQVTVDSGCEVGDGQYSVDGATIAFSSLTYQGAPCTEPSVQTVANKVMAVLDGGPVSHDIEEVTLRITKGDRGLMFRAAN